MDEVPEYGAVFTFGKSKFGDESANKFWVKNDPVVAVACGDEHTAVVTNSGRAYTFGSNQWGQLALGHTNPTNKPSFVKALKGRHVLYLACGRSHTVFGTKDEVYACGANGDNQVNESNASEVLSPYPIPSLSGVGVKRLSCGVEHSLVLGHCGNVFLWGSGSEGQLGMGEKVTVLLNPTVLQFTDEKVRDASCGYYHTGIVTQSGKVFTFGESENGKLGLGDSAEEESYGTPQPVFLVDSAKKISCGNTCTAVMTSSGALYMCGDGQRGQLGFSPNTLNKCVYTLTKVPCPPISDMAVGEGHTAVVTKSGHLYTFGDGRHGKLCHGDDNLSALHSPHLVETFSTLATVMGVSCGGCHTMVMAKPGRPVQEEPAKVSAARTKRHLKGARPSDTVDVSSTPEISDNNKENHEDIKIVQENVKSLESALGEKPDKIVQLNKNEKKETSDKGKSGQNKVKEKKAAEKKAPEKKAAEKKASEKKAPENSKEKPAPKKEAESEEDSGSETDVPGDSSEVTDSEVESEEEDGLGSGGGSGGMFMDNIMGIEDLEPAQPVANGTHNVIEVKSSNVPVVNTEPPPKPVPKTSAHADGKPASKTAVLAVIKDDKLKTEKTTVKSTVKSTEEEEVKPATTTLNKEVKPATTTFNKGSETETDEEDSEYEDETEDEDDVTDKKEEPVKTLVSETPPDLRDKEDEIVRDDPAPPTSPPQAEPIVDPKPKKTGFWKKKPKKEPVESGAGTQSSSKACVIL